MLTNNNSNNNKKQPSAPNNKIEDLELERIVQEPAD
jgi:hypothetical protein